MSSTVNAARIEPPEPPKVGDCVEISRIGDDGWDPGVVTAVDTERRRLRGTFVNRRGFHGSFGVDLDEYRVAWRFR